MKSLLNKLWLKIEKLGFEKVSKDLGYHSPNAVRHWIDKKKIPEFKIERVKEYLKK